MVDFEPQIQPDGSVRISQKQAKIHRTGEGLALFIALPTLAWIATRERKLSPDERLALGVLAVGTLVFDGYLWTRYRRAGTRHKNARIRAAKISRRLAHDRQLRARAGGQQK